VIPIRDLNPASRRPWLTYGIIAVNVAVWLVEVVIEVDGGDEALQSFIWRHGLVPGLAVPPVSLASLGTFVTHLFVHGGWMHVIGNMWFLFVFGDNLEDRLGRVRFFAFYLACGLAAAFAQTAIQYATGPAGAPQCLALAHDPRCVPMVGASGAIAGVLAGYVTLFPRARVLTLIPIFVFIQFAEIRAVFFVVIWFGYQLLMGFSSLGGRGSGVAFFAHIGGFVAGLALIHLFKPRAPRPNPTDGFQPPPRIRMRRPDDGW